MTDNELIKAYEQLIDLLVKKKKVCICEQGLLEDILDLLNRQQAEIEKQKMVIEVIEDSIHPLPFEIDFDKAIQKAKSEAIKELVKKLKTARVEHTSFSQNNWYEIDDVFIDNIEKEIMEEKTE